MLVEADEHSNVHRNLSSLVPNSSADFFHVPKFIYTKVKNVCVKIVNKVKMKIGITKNEVGVVKKTREDVMARACGRKRGGGKIQD
ncbi:unnamed protein product [Prunus armeniaca]|uniref:Uncharacterized protein n=1 Tax=Prunus armeniaca TaxID=36596 RepID=A0A6J5W1U4_PRUAR|nr:unnamed protein product [Prunus armeniaca]